MSPGESFVLFVVIPPFLVGIFMGMNVIIDQLSTVVSLLRAIQPKETDVYLTDPKELPKCN
jgi:hypothetical protein